MFQVCIDPSKHRPYGLAFGREKEVDRRTAGMNIELSLNRPVRLTTGASSPEARSTIDRYSHFSKNRRIASIEASRILSWPASHLSTVERDTPSSREIRAFFHFDRPAKVRKRIKTSAISRSRVLSERRPSV